MKIVSLIAVIDGRDRFAGHCFSLKSMVPCIEYSSLYFKDTLVIHFLVLKSTCVISKGTDWLNKYFLSVTPLSAGLAGADTRLLERVGVSHLLVGLRLELVSVVGILESGVLGEVICASCVVTLTSDGDEANSSTFCVLNGIGFSCFLLGVWKFRNLKKI